MLSEYFVLTQDPYYHSAIQFPISQYYRYSRKIQQSDYTELPRSKVVLLKSRDCHLYPDILSRQVFMVTQRILDVILLFNKNMSHSTRYLMDSRKKVMIPYYIPHIPAIDCLSNKTKAAPNQFVLDDRKIMSDIHIFQIAGAEHNIVIASLAFVEAMLRRKPEMILYTRTQIDEVK